MIFKILIQIIISRTTQIDGKVVKISRSTGFWDISEIKPAISQSSWFWGVQFFDFLKKTNNISKLFWAFENLIHDKTN